MKAKDVSAALVIVLAVIAAAVSIGLIVGMSVWPIIIIYWCTLTAKNLVDYIGTKEDKKHDGD